MSTIDEWADMMPATVTVLSYLRSDGYAVPVFADTPNTYPARVTYRTRRVLNPAGEEVVSRGTVWLATVDPISTKDQVTLPDGTTPLILQADQIADEDGPLYTRLDFA